jgi:L-asparaginase/Glu-tRNA(Gln) amidotransferase subunit D
MSFSDPLTVVVTVLAVVVVVIGGVSVVLALRLRRLAADQRRAFEGVEIDVVANLARHRRRLDELVEAVAAARAHTSEVEAKAGHGLSRIGVIRYDAFDDIGGQLSFSAALLDEHADGVVLTSITGRAGGRTYLKSVTGGESESLLSEEEVAAVSSAREQQRGERIVDQGKRRWRQR